MKNKKVLAVFLSVLMCLSWGNLFPVRAEETTTDYFETNTFEEFLALSEDEVCAISEEAKSAYEETLSLEYFGETYVTFDGAFFRSAYKTGDYAGNREMVRAELKLPKELYRGMDALDAEMDPSASSFWIPVFFYDDAIDTYAAEYGYEELEVAARIIVWMNLSPNVVSAYCSDGLTGVNPELYYYEYTFDEFLTMDALAMYGRPYQPAQYYIDALAYVQEHPELDVSDPVFEVWVRNGTSSLSSGYVAEDENGESYVETESLFADMYLTADWIPEEGVELPHEENTFYISLNREKVNAYLEKGVSETEIYARAYAWIHGGSNANVIGLGTEESASLIDKYTYDEFLALGEEGICGISDEIARLYEKWAAETADFHSGIIHYIYVTTKSQYMKYVSTESGGYETGDADAVRDVLCIPEEMWLTYKNGNEDALYRYYDVRAYMSEPYDVYEYSYLVAATLVWLEANPEVESVEMEHFATGGIWAPAPVRAGDVNMDEKISVLDVILVSKYAAKTVVLNEAQISAADCNGDGAADHEDVIALLRYIVELDDVLPVAMVG